ncbi:MAG: winged helix-turn-helix domain-containing protein [Usitatibacteraceae bacterium]
MNNQTADEGPNVVRIGALIGDQARSAVLTALMGGRALTATELADAAGVTRQTVSAHLAKLADAQLITVENQGRHRYFRLADDDVAAMIESLMGVAVRKTAAHVRTGPRAPAMRKARVCYDHLAGEISVQIYESLLAHQAIAPCKDGLSLTASGVRWFSRAGIDVDGVLKQRRNFCRACLDWSERRHHLAGALGAAMLERIFTLGWAARERDSRVVIFNRAGEKALRELFLLTAVQC